MYGSQCPKCLRHMHENIFVYENGKRYLIERCAEPSCLHNFEIMDSPLATPPKEKDKDSRRANW